MTAGSARLNRKAVMINSEARHCSIWLRRLPAPDRAEAVFERYREFFGEREHVSPLFHSLRTACRIV